MKKILAIVLTVSFSSLVFASGDMFAKPTNYFDGLYVGIGGGVNHTTADASASSVDTFAPLITQLDATISQDFILANNLNADLGEVNAAGELFVGYGRTANIKSDHNNFYLGVELFGKYTPIDMSASGSTQFFRPVDGTEVAQLAGYVSEKLENDYSFGGDLRIGYLFTPKTMIYVLAGVEAANFDYEVNSSGPNYLISALYLNGNFSDEADQLKFGFMPGVGIETMITDNFSLRAQYVYTFFGDMDVNGSHSLTQVINERNILLNNSIDGDADNISRGLFTVDLTYRFNGI
jgi:opacity protein-like surface antigen